LVTVHPEHVATGALRKINSVLIVGREPLKLAGEFADAIQVARPEMPAGDLERGQAVLWQIDRNEVSVMNFAPPRSEHYRHRRKYAEGELEPERTFYFRGPEGKLALRAQNLNLFVQIAEGIDDETWLFHLERADYSNWICNALGDQHLADEIRAVEKDSALSARESKDRIKNAILQKYTAPA
ncbi:MAG: hypothetical protein JO270_19515, partial [Acidobacteriaceae bacterium]|nr:hypothetical protein [Acidobacteriaceae bacterium]